MRPFRFGVQAGSASSGAEWRALAKRTEELGYDTFHVGDHYPIQDLAPVPAMAVAAAVTETLKVGCRVFCVDFHLPAVLAKEAATLDLLSDGRLELGLGAGWVDSEYEQMGIPFEAAGTRIERLAEVVALVKAHFGEDEIKVNGNHVRVHGYRGTPTPVQRPHPPIMIGGGARRVLSLAAREADIVSLNFNNRAGVVGPDGVQSATAAATDEKIGWIREAAGDHFADLELEVAAYFTVVTSSSASAAADLGAKFGLSASDMRSHPNALIGSVEEICDSLEARRQRYGISYITVSQRNVEAFAPVVARLRGT
jgi:probable F420-dependent oxidoreductase